MYCKRSALMIEEVWNVLYPRTGGNDIPVHGFIFSPPHIPPVSYRPPRPPPPTSVCLWNGLINESKTEILLLFICSHPSNCWIRADHFLSRTSEQFKVFFFFVLYVMSTKLQQQFWDPQSEIWFNVKNIDRSSVAVINLLNRTQPCLLWVCHHVLS